ncbi:restriction endonuclease subunit S [Limnobacter sp. P1]|uniref:restriction endonuclease subunit S n=1 Tax=Limnobacter olei TaxID=3031298 RepID=UPI0023B13B9F|nr:restriction endonuclease subunit S [Limnobacter sp. P1]
MKWEIKPVSELCFLAIDCVNKTAPLSENVTEYKMLRTTNVKGGFIDFESVRYVEEDVFKKWIRRAQPKYGDVLFTREAPAGEVGRFTAKAGNYFLGQRLFLYRPDPKKLDWNYLAYVLQSPQIQGWVQGAAYGATVPHLAVSDMEHLKIPAPPITIQKKIGDILSRYDDLIENNLKRIKLLEEMAQITYEEWFVRMRFPGHESTPINPETGLPDGWYKKRLGEICTLTMGQSPKSEFYNLEGNGLPFHQGVKDYGERFPTNACWSTSGSRYAERGDILFSVRAPVGRLNIALERMILGRGLAAIKHKDNAQGFLYCLLKQQFFEEDMMGSGAIFSSVTKNDMHRIEVIVPSKTTLNDFNEIVETTDRQIEILHHQNVGLREARDILLPRLMTGVIDVEKYDPAQLLKEAA